MIIKNLIIFEILIPILVAAVGILNKRAGIAFYLTLLALIALSVASALILKGLIEQPDAIRYHFGGWLPPVGIEFKVTRLSATFLAIISIVALLTFLSGKKILYSEVPESKISVFCSIFLILLVGLFGLIMTNDFFNLYVFIEITSLTAYALVHLSTDRAAIRAAFDYLVIGTIAATLILIGIGYLYVASGTLNMDDFVKKLPDVKALKTFKAGYVLMLAGLFIKSALFPLHSWMVKVYSRTSSFILPFIGSVSTKVYALLACKLIWFIFTPEIVFNNSALQKFMLTAGGLGAIFGALSALYQSNMRSMLAFSSVAQTGYIFIAIAIDAKVALILICSHILTSCALFMLSGHIHYLRQTYKLQGLQLLYKVMPYSVALFIINAASLVGIPLTFGFMAKLNLILSLLSQKMWPLVAVVAFASFLTFCYLWRFIRAFLFYEDRPTLPRPIPDSNNIAIVVISILTLLNLALGFVIPAKAGIQYFLIQ